MRLIATIALLALSLGAGVPALAETNVGVTAAVNQDARGIIGSSVKTISLGDSVVFNQRIETGAGGLVQVLLADGTTFMVGPNSDLVIDSFVYDPNAGTAQVAATFTKGVLRFIGGQTSKTEGGVTINTPVGTMGIRGAMVDVVLDPPEGTPPHIDMLFGNEVTLEQGQQLLGRLYAAGYSLALGPNGTFEVLKTPPGWGSQIQAALAGRTGTNGGAPKGPNDEDVKNSDVAENNSGKGPNGNSGNPPLSKEELAALLLAAAQYDELRNYLGVLPVEKGFSGGFGFGNDASAPGIVSRDEETDSAINAEVAFSGGVPVAIALVMTGPECRTCQFFVYDSTSGEVSLIDGEDVVDLTVESAMIREANDNDREALSLTCDCDFVRWGYWGLEANGEFNEQAINLQIQDAAWVTGDLTTPEQLEVVIGTTDWDTTHATYSGDMVGTVVSESTYVTSGSFDMDWNFGFRRGTISGGFGGEYFEAGLESNEVGGGFFDDGFTSDMAFEGAFVNDGETPAGGVIGNFAIEQLYGTASGVFFGTRGDNEPGLGFPTN